MATTKKKTKKKLPKTFVSFVQKYPELGRTHEHIAKFVEQSGPLSIKTCDLIKIGICIGAGLESALRSHVRRAVEHGATPVEIEQAILLAMNTCGFPRTVSAWKWAQEQFARDQK